jgi:hypothetical protein
MRKSDLKATPKESSERRKAASRANGAKSRGPVTEAGKAKSRLNSTKHGCLATLLTFRPQDEEIYQQMQALYLARFQPRDQVEFDLVEQIVYCNYQMKQAWIQQAAVLGLQMSTDKETVEMEWGGEHPFRKPGGPRLYRVHRGQPRDSQPSAVRSESRPSGQTSH